MNSLIPNVPTHEIILLPNPPQNLSKNEYITKINKLVEKDTEYRKLLCDVILKHLVIHLKEINI